MTMVTISDQDPRSLKAVEIAAGAGQWLKCRMSDGRKAYGVPSQCSAGRYYLTDTAACTCEDFRRHGLTPARIGQAGDHAACKHILAVRLHLALIKAHQQPSRRTRAPKTAAAEQQPADRPEFRTDSVRNASAPAEQHSADTVPASRPQFVVSHTTSRGEIVHFPVRERRGPTQYGQCLSCWQFADLVRGGDHKCDACRAKEGE